MNKPNLDKNNVTSFKGKKTKKALLLEIESIPEELQSEHLKDYIIADDECYIMDYYNSKTNIKIGSGIILFSLIVHFAVGGRFNFDSPLFITGPFFLFGLYQIIKTMIIKNEKLILDRMQGLFSYPNYCSNKPAIIYFKEAILILAYKGKTGTPTLVTPYTNVKFGGFTLTTFSVKKMLAFYVWYMDKNRPLPPGTAFDPYRQKDFERRKSEGFPPPLYYSNGIITPEATPEQQAERERYWKDRDYFAPPIKRPENSEIFNTRTHQNWSKCNFENGEHKLTNTWYEFTFNDGKIIYMLTNENGVGYLPPENLNYKTTSLTIKDGWF